MTPTVHDHSQPGGGAAAVGPGVQSPLLGSEELLARAALTGLKPIGPNRLRWLLGAGTATAALADLRSGSVIGPDGRVDPARSEGRPPGLTDNLIRTWQNDVRAGDPAQLAGRLQALGVALMAEDHVHWPFAHDPEPPLVLFFRGRPEALAVKPRVALVGTRRCSAVGRQVAFTLGRDLARAGVAVVSGLASGIDGAAHRGALAAGGVAIGVAGTGINRPYPRSNRQLWEEVAASGLLFTEAPLDAGGDPWRFPARNRLIAGLADLVVVVESHPRGGALLTAGEAADRGVPVMAVPGAVTSSASAGSNRLLADGCPPACTVEDVLDLLGHRPTPAVQQLLFPPAGSGPPAPAAGLSPLGRHIVAEVAAGAVPVDVLVATTGLAVPAVLAEVQRLQEAGLVVLDGSTVIYP